MVKTRSLRFRLLIVLLPSLTVLLALGCGGLYWLQRELLYRDFDRQLSRGVMQSMRMLRRYKDAAEIDTLHEAAILGDFAFIQVWDMESKTARVVLPKTLDLGEQPLIRAKNRDEFELRTMTLSDGREIRVGGRIFGRRPPPERRDRPAKTEPDGRSPQTSGAGASTQPTSAPAPPWKLHGRRPPEQLVLVGADLQPVRAALQHWLAILLIAGAAGEALVTMVVLLAVRRGLRPLVWLAGDIASIDKGALAYRVDVDRLPGEVRPVAMQLNGLLQRLEEAFQREQAFTASAAHELRTPLAGLRSQMEVCLRRGRPVEEYQRTLAGCLDGAVTMQQMVDSLLDLARLDGGLAKPRAEELDAAALVVDAWRACEAAAAERGCVGRLSVPDSLIVRSDHRMLDGILANLLGNAAAYADPGGTIEITAANGDQTGGFHLTVRNDASTLDAEDLPKLFDRFWRKDLARTEAAHHAGLGLSVVRRCAEALGGSVEAALDAPNVLSLAVHLPPADFV